MTRKSMPSRAQIVKHWYNVALEAHENNSLDEFPWFVERLMIDVGEPFCWACNYFSNEWDYASWDKARKNPTLAHLFKNWNRLPLERAHLVPKSLDGSYDPSNLVLLCARCHRDAPDVKDPTFMLNWMERHRQELEEKAFAEFKHVCDALDVKPRYLIEKWAALRVFCKHEFYEFSLQYSTTHGVEHYSFASELYCAHAFPIETLKEKAAQAGYSLEEICGL